MLNVAVCDDERSICEHVAIVIETYADTMQEKINISMFFSGEALGRELECGREFDLIFLDIQLPEQSGIELGQLLREKLDNQTTQIVFISGQDNYMRELFPLRPNNFLQKPFSTEQIIAELKKAQKLLGQRQKTYDFYTGGEYHRIPYYRIQYFSSENRKVIVHTMAGEYCCYAKLSLIAKGICENNFMQIHKSYLVNFQHIQECRYESAVLIDGTTLAISKAYQKSVRSFMQSKLRKG